jgi:hypothetical protein
VFDGGRNALAHLARMLVGKKMLPISKIRNNKWHRISLILFSIVPLIIFLGVKKPVLLVMLAGVVSAISMPLLAGLVFWSLVKQVPAEYRPNKFYLINLAMSVIVYVMFMAQSLKGLLQ